MDPLFPDEPSTNNAHHQEGYILPRQSGHHVAPGHYNKDTEAAIELIRGKIDALYAKEPDARQEVAEVKRVDTPRSKHQQFMYELSTSGKPLAEIQTTWHSYYIGLSDDEKRQVWQEFYAANNRQPSAYTAYVQQQAAVRTQHPTAHRGQQSQHQTHPTSHGAMVVSVHEQSAPPAPAPATDRRSFATVKKQVLKKVRTSHSAQIKAKQHLQSLIFGLGTGALVLLVVLFSFFNEVVIAPFIHPGSHAQATPIILNTDGIAPTDKNEVIIPKINVELPAVYSNSVKEADIQNNLESGVVHYPSTSTPGQGGNAAFFGHSSNNIFNKGNYKFAFVLLHELVPGDIFYITYSGKVYTYKVYDRKIVEPTDTWVLNAVPGKSTVTLITCDPPGTSKHRLVVWGEQVTPDPNGNVAAPTTTVTAPQQLPSNSPSLWSRFVHWLTS